MLRQAGGYRKVSGLGIAVLAGTVLGFFAFLPATAVPATLHFALPHLPFGWFLGIWVAMIAHPLSW